MLHHTSPIDAPWFNTTEPLYFLDIETTGLVKQKDQVMMLGILTNQSGQLCYHSWLAEKSSEEGLLLQSFLSFIVPHSALYTYTAFDLTFIQERCLSHHLETGQLRTLQHIIFKKRPLFKALMQHISTTRETFEAFIHYERQITTQGRAIAHLSKAYWSESNPVYLQLLSGHNQEEVLSLLTYWRFEKLFLSIHPTQLIDTQNTQDAITYTFSTRFGFSTSLTLTLASLTCNYHQETNTLDVRIPVTQLTLRRRLPAKDYYIVNGELLHHSLAQCIPPRMRQKATRETAYVEDTAFFVPCFSSDTQWVDPTGRPFLKWSTLDLTTYLQSLSKTISRGLFK